MRFIYTLILLLTVSFSYSQVEGTWQIAPQAGALGVGQNLGDISWWSNNEADLTVRACYFDDKFVFNADGSFKNEMDGETWLEQWQSGSPDACGAPVAPHDGSNAATWSYDSTAGTIMLTGIGAHLGLPKVINGAEISNPADAPASITYNVELSSTLDTMYINIDFGGGFWHYIMVKAGTSGMSDLEIDNFNVYPNPSSSIINVESLTKIDEIIIRDITGKLVLNVINPDFNESINVSGLGNGIYLIEAVSGINRKVQKLIIK